MAIVALFDDGSVLLERQFRYPHRREFIEIPAGKLEPGEPHLDTAKRELVEETGYAAEDWRDLGVIHTAIAYTDEAIQLYLARNLSRSERKLDQGEFLETLVRPFDEALRMIRDGEHHRRQVCRRAPLGIPVYSREIGREARGRGATAGSRWCRLPKEKQLPRSHSSAPRRRRKCAGWDD